VVDFSGGGGLLLLIQPDSADSMTSEARTIFMLLPLKGVSDKVNVELTLRTLESVASRPLTAPRVGSILLSGPV